MAAPTVSAKTRHLCTHCQHRLVSKFHISNYPTVNLLHAAASSRRVLQDTMGHTAATV